MYDVEYQLHHPRPLLGFGPRSEVRALLPHLSFSSGCCPTNALIVLCGFAALVVSRQFLSVQLPTLWTKRAVQRRTEARGDGEQEPRSSLDFEKKKEERAWADERCYCESFRSSRLATKRECHCKEMQDAHKRHLNSNS